MGSFWSRKRLPFSATMTLNHAVKQRRRNFFIEEKEELGGVITESNGGNLEGEIQWLLIGWVVTIWLAELLPGGENFFCSRSQCWSSVTSCWGCKVGLLLLVPALTLNGMCVSTLLPPNSISVKFPFIHLHSIHIATAIPLLLLLLLSRFSHVRLCVTP